MPEIYHALQKGSFADSYDTRDTINIARLIRSFCLCRCSKLQTIHKQIVTGDTCHTIRRQITLVC